MKKFDFDSIINRSNTDSMKWDMNGAYYGREDVIPMWVADMDFACAPPIVEAVKRRAANPVYGYSARTEQFKDAVQFWLTKRHNCDVPKEWLAFAPPGVIYAMYVMLQLVSEKDSKIIIHMPNYDPLFDMVVKSGRKLVECPLKEHDGRFTFNLELFEQLVKKEKPVAFIMSSPHNPTGRVWTKQELSSVAKICLDNGVYMLIDEIHADFVSKARSHYAFARLGEDVARASMICYSANKAFNLGGLAMSSIIIADEKKRVQFNEQMAIAQTRLDTIFGVVATQTAYTDPECEQWLDAAIEYVDANKVYTSEFFEKKCPKIRMINSEGTYLVWLDCSALGLEGKKLEEFMIWKAGVTLCAGYEFGEQGKSYMRINLACSRALLDKALNQIADAVKQL